MSMNIVGSRNLRKLLEQKVDVHPDKTFLIYEDEQETLSCPSMRSGAQPVASFAQYRPSFLTNRAAAWTVEMRNSNWRR